MSRSQREWPREWLMTDERMGDRLWEAINRLPPNRSGVVLRHYGLGLAERAALAERIAALCRTRGLMLGVAADRELALNLSADLVHNPSEQTSELPFSRSVHTVDEAIAARRAGAALVFVSPVNVTRSHPERAPLGHALAGRIAEAAGVPAIALGGMNADGFALLKGAGFHGWAGIDAWLSEAN
jgi:thiamine-phosphate pyrophosphorylase